MLDELIRNMLLAFAAALLVNLLLLANLVTCLLVLMSVVMTMVSWITREKLPVYGHRFFFQTNQFCYHSYMFQLEVCRFYW